MLRPVWKPACFFSVLLVLWLLTACATPLPATPAAAPLPPPATPTVEPSGLPADEFATLNSLEQLDEYPLYSLHYSGDYPRQAAANLQLADLLPGPPPAPVTCRANWGCSLFAALGDEEERLYGRNFDWQFSPALLLFTDPPDGYASISMVDIAYLGFDGQLSKNLTDLPLDQRRALLEAPSLPFDGMNEKGLSIGMAAVPAGEMVPDPQKKTIDQLLVIREILDHAATVDEAIQILESYNIDMGTVPIHYLIASALGDSALVEFYRGEIRIFRNELPWQQATNFLVAGTDGNPAGNCQRYDRINARLQESAGKLTTPAALRLLSDVSQRNTQWSIVYDMTSGEVSIVMGRDYSGQIHTIDTQLIP